MWSRQMDHAEMAVSRKSRKKKKLGKLRGIIVKKH